MSTKEETFQETSEAIDYLRMLYDTRNYLFRGHQSPKYRLQSTLFRHQLIIAEIVDESIAELIERFKAGLSAINKYPREKWSNHDWLEMARHFGLPSPCIDLTYSPYIALFFAFNGVRIPKRDEEDEFVTIYALNIRQTAWGWGKYKGRLGLKRDFSPEAQKAFLFPNSSLFEKKYPRNTIQFIPHPSRYNLRMINQLGALLYDTLDYNSIGFKDLEDFVDNIEEPRPAVDRSIPPNTLIKVHLNKKCLVEVFSELELVGVNGGNLFKNEEGVVMDVVNTYYYNPRYMYMRDINR